MLLVIMSYADKIEDIIDIKIKSELFWSFYHIRTRRFVYSLPNEAYLLYEH